MTVMLSKLLSAYESDMGTLCDRPHCTRHAVWVVSVHMIDHCTEGKVNTVALRCRDCADVLAGQVSEKVRDIKAAVRTKGADYRCTGCGLVVTDKNVLTIDRLVAVDA